jgi:hypothetical protein
MPLLLQAQNISGKIRNEKHHPVEYANIVILSHLDSTLIAGAISSESGSFQFSNLTSGQKILKISCLGYLIKWLDIEIKQDTTIGIAHTGTLFE